MAHDEERLYRAQAGGAQGEGAPVDEYNDGGGFRAIPPFAQPYTKITRPLARLIVDLARLMTLSDVALWLGLSWDTVKTVVKARLEKDYKRIGYRYVRQIVAGHFKMHHLWSLQSAPLWTRFF